MDEGPTADVGEALGAAQLESAALAGSEDESVHAIVSGGGERKGQLPMR